MAMFSTTDERQAARCREALLRDVKINEKFETVGAAELVTGKVQSVIHDSGSFPQRWTITILPE